LGERDALQLVLLSAILDKNSVAEALRETDERATRFDLGQLARVTDERDLTGDCSGQESAAWRSRRERQRRLLPTTGVMRDRPVPDPASAPPRESVPSHAAQRERSVEE
jgi:hypothetical protein